MGFKTVILGIMLLIAGLFLVQNLQPIALIFFGFNSLTLPLSLWALIALLSGIISSLLINLLLSSNSNSSPPPKYPDNSPPSPPRNPRQSVKQSVNYSNTEYRETLEELNKPYPPKVNQTSTITEDDEFDFLEEDNHISQEKILDNDFSPPLINTPEKLENSQSSPPENLPKSDETVKVSSPSPLEADKPLENKPLITPPPQEDSLKSKTMTKTRDASLYSFSSGEKTQISPVSPPQRKKPVITNNDEVYDVPYRVINPSEEQGNINDDEEDWDF